MAQGPSLFDDVSPDVAVVRRLLASQLPAIADLPVVALPRSGTDNAVFRLGDQLAVRLPRRAGAVVQVRRDEEVMAAVQDAVSCALPRVVAVGEPGEGYPYPWSVVRWVDGEVADPRALVDPRRLADDLAQLVLALRRVENADGPAPSADNFGRGGRLQTRTARTHRSIEALDGLIDAPAARQVWSEALDADPARRAVWIHGDLHASNLIVHKSGGLAGVIDWAGAAVGDAACDLLAAWMLFEADERRAFRTAVGADDDEWARGRGWTLTVAVVYLAVYGHRVPSAADWIRGLDAVLTSEE
jgi:aminoglycoside phosphotransferase (APT) family kinase protein